MDNHRAMIKCAFFFQLPIYPTSWQDEALSRHGVSREVPSEPLGTDILKSQKLPSIRSGSVGFSTSSEGLNSLVKAFPSLASLRPLSLGELSPAEEIWLLRSALNWRMGLKWKVAEIYFGEEATRHLGPAWPCS